MSVVGLAELVAFTEPELLKRFSTSMKMFRDLFGLNLITDGLNEILDLVDASQFIGKPMATIASKINSETIESRIRFMLNLVEILRKESVQNAIKTISLIINILTSMSSKLTNIYTSSETLFLKLDNEEKINTTGKTIRDAGDTLSDNRFETFSSKYLQILEMYLTVYEKYKGGKKDKQRT